MTTTTNRVSSGVTGGKTKRLSIEGGTASISGSIGGDVWGGTWGGAVLGVNGNTWGATWAQSVPGQDAVVSELDFLDTQRVLGTITETTTDRVPAGAVVSATQRVGSAPTNGTTRRIP